MPIVIGADIGTTTITALTVDVATGETIASCTAANDAEITSASGKAHLRSEWDTDAILRRLCGVLRAVAPRSDAQREELAGICLTGQQHGVVLVDPERRPLTPLINWQDWRGEDRMPGIGRSYVAQAGVLAGPDAPRRCGCVLSAGFMGTTLFWLKETGALPANATACFITDYAASFLTGQAPTTEPTMAASSGLLNVAQGAWDAETLSALGLPGALLPTVRACGEKLGGLSSAAAAATGLPEGLPVLAGMGDNQASFLGSVAEKSGTVLANVGTGAQVAAYTDRFAYAPPAETRPFPGGGYLLVYAGLSGGRSLALFEDFLRKVGADLFGVADAPPLYSKMAQLAGQVSRGADGLRCDPYFAGTRSDPDRRASWTGISPENFTPAHFTRALFDGMARSLREGWMLIEQAGAAPCYRLVGAGNGLRRNPVLAGIVAEEFGVEIAFPRHEEEAAFGAALLAAVGAGVYPDLASAARLIRYDTAVE